MMRGELPSGLTFLGVKTVSDAPDTLTDVKDVENANRSPKPEPLHVPQRPFPIQQADQCFLPLPRSRC